MVTSADLMLSAESRDADSAPAPAAARAMGEDRDELTAVWRLLRRLGVADADVDDATQQVLLIATERRASIRPARRRAFLYGTALRVAKETARRNPRRVDLDDALPDIELPDPEELIDQRRARELLDELLARMTFDLRVVFVLFEIEELSTQEIAGVLELKRGTVASRLRRAREEFTARLARIQAKRSGRGGGR